jgi:phenylalanyl-tRNA synthetase beta chain
MVGAGASEAWTTSFLSVGDLSRAGLGPGSAVEVENPLDQSQDLLRTSLLPGLLRAARFNVERQVGALSLFEIGSVFRRRWPGEGPGLVTDVAESEQIGLVALGAGVDATYAVRAWEVLARGLRVDAASLEPLGPGGGSGLLGTVPGAGPRGQATGALAAAGSLQAGRAAAIVVAGRPLGVVGELATHIAAAHDLPGRVALLLVDLGALLDAPGRSWAVQPASRFPASDLDVALVVPEEVPASVLAETVRDAAGDLAETVVLFDVWRDGSLGEAKRSLAFRARLRAADRTLTDKEVAEVRERVATAALRRHGASLRGPGTGP